MALSSLLWALPVFFVTGFVVGVILRVVMPTYERGFFQLIGLFVMGAFTLLLVAGLMSVVRSVDPETTSDPTVRRIPLILLYAPFFFGAIAGRQYTPRARLSRRRRTTRPSGTHQVPTELRTPGETTAPAHDLGAESDRPLPTAFGPGGIDLPASRPPAARGTPLPPPGQPPEQPPAPGC